MAVRDGAEQERKRLATAAGITSAASVALSGADLMQAAVANETATAVGPGNDGARFEQLRGGSGS